MFLFFLVLKQSVFYWYINIFKNVYQNNRIYQNRIKRHFLSVRFTNVNYSQISYEQ